MTITLPSSMTMSITQKLTSLIRLKRLKKVRESLNRIVSYKIQFLAGQVIKTTAAKLTLKILPTAKSTNTKIIKRSINLRSTMPRTIRVKKMSLVAVKHLEVTQFSLWILADFLYQTTFYKITISLLLTLN